jgi:hypothetical protein
MYWTEAGEIIKAVAPAFTSAAACVGAWIGWRGLEKWRSETLGKRQAEVAEATLADVYEMEEILRQARSPWIPPHETARREGVSDELSTNSNYVPEARLLAHEDFFGRFRARKFAFAAVFGREMANPIDELWNIRLEINNAVVELIRNKEMASGDEEDRTIWKQWRATAFRPLKSEDDTLGKRISQQIADVEKVCRPAIEARARP